MNRKLYVGNLSYSTDDNELHAHFSGIGEVASARVIFDRETGRSKGFGFVEMNSEDSAAEAVEKLNGSSLSGRNIRVSEAKPQEPRSGGGGGGRSFRKDR